MASSLVLGCVILPLRQHAESRNLGQTLFGSPVQSCVKIFLHDPQNVSAAHPIIALRRNISATHSPNLAGMFIHYVVFYFGHALAE